ncbi:MAG TPA: hypothetical protein PKA58_17020, partial [Polyangium sp.]|nr:hypothetical protein [Polyangium sp.]
EVYAGRKSARAFDLTDSQIILEVPVTPANILQGSFGIDLNGPGDNDVELFLEEGTLKFGVDIAGVDKELGSIAYSPDQHRWWRIRHAANSVFWETAPDGKTWTTRLEVSPPPVPVNHLDVEIEGGTWIPQVAPGEARADNLNLPPQ